MPGASYQASTHSSSDGDQNGCSSVAVSLSDDQVRDLTRSRLLGDGVRRQYLVANLDGFKPGGRSSTAHALATGRRQGSSSRRCRARAGASQSLSIVSLGRQAPPEAVNRHCQKVEESQPAPYRTT